MFWPQARTQRLGRRPSFPVNKTEPWGCADDARNPGDWFCILIRCDKPEYLASRLFGEQQVVEVRLHADRAGLLVRTRSADGFYKLLNHIALNGVQIESVTPADDDAQSVYEYLIGSEAESL